MSALQIVGRSSSHFTRMPRIFAEELGVAYELVPIYDMTETSPAVYANNPALKLPILRRGAAVLFGAENICRAIAEEADRSGSKRRVVWPEELRDDLSRNAQELVRHAAAAQVQLVMGTVVGKLPADNVYFAKARTGFDGALRWLDTQLDATLGALPGARDLSLFEVTLFCLADHLTFRPTLPIAEYPALERFRRVFAQRPSAQSTQYRFDAPPSN